MLETNVVILAGGGRGLGEATAHELARLGATVVVNDLGSGPTGEGESEEPAETTAASYGTTAELRWPISATSPR